MLALPGNGGPVVGRVRRSAGKTAERSGKGRRGGLGARREEAVIERLFQLGQSRFLHGKYQQAAAYFTAALKFNPTDARLYAHRGDAYRLQGEYERALADFHTALRLDPSNPSALVHRANAYHLSGEQEQALADCAAALELHPNNPAAYRIRAVLIASWGGTTWPWPI